MELDALRARVRAFADARDWGRYHSPRNLAMAVSVEAGELLELFLWTDDGGPQPANPVRAAQVADEAADVLICLLNLCDRAGIDLSAAVVDKLARAEAKYPADQVRGKALKYDEYPTWDGAKHVAIDDPLPALFVAALDGGDPASPTVIGTCPRVDAAPWRFEAGADGAVSLVDPDTGHAMPLTSSVRAFDEAAAVLVALDTTDLRAVASAIAQVRALDPARFDDPAAGWQRWLGELLGR